MKKALATMTLAFGFAFAGTAAAQRTPDFIEQFSETAVRIYLSSDYDPTTNFGFDPSITFEAANSQLQGPLGFFIDRLEERYQKPTTDKDIATEINESRGAWRTIFTSSPFELATEGRFRSPAEIDTARTSKLYQVVFPDASLLFVRLAPGNAKPTVLLGDWSPATIGGEFAWQFDFRATGTRSPIPAPAGGNIEAWATPFNTGILTPVNDGSSRPAFGQFPQAFYKTTYINAEGTLRIIRGGAVGDPSGAVFVWILVRDDFFPNPLP